jgi:hypothetical protein
MKLLGAHRLSDTTNADNEREPRLITETGLDQRLADIIEPVLIDIGQRQQARTAADRRCGRARESRSTADRLRRDGRRDPEGRALALRHRDQHPRRHQPEDRRDPLQRLLEVVEAVEDYSTRSPLELGPRPQPGAQVGDVIADPLPPLDFGRIAAQSAKQVIVQKVREAERDRQYDEYKDRIGEIVNGTVKRVEYGNVIVDLGRGEAIIRRDEMIPRETFKVWRPRPRLCLRRAPRAARPADLPVAHPSAVHGQAVHHGSAGNL